MPFSTSRRGLLQLQEHFIPGKKFWNQTPQKVEFIIKVYFVNLRG